MAATAEGLVSTLGWGVDDFEAACKQADRAALSGALAILRGPDHPDQPGWVAERASWGAEYIDRILCLPTCERCGAPIGFGYAYVISVLRLDVPGTPIERRCSRCPT